MLLLLLLSSMLETAVAGLEASLPDTTAAVVGVGAALLLQTASVPASVPALLLSKRRLTELQPQLCNFGCRQVGVPPPCFGVCMVQTVQQKLAGRFCCLQLVQTLRTPLDLLHLPASAVVTSIMNVGMQ